MRVALQTVLEPIADAASDLLDADVSVALVHARLADALRDGGMVPPAPRALASHLSRLDAESLRRLALLVGLLDQPDLARSVLWAAARQPDLEAWVHGAFLAVAQALGELTMMRLTRGEAGREALVRRFLFEAGVRVADESEDEQLQRLERLSTHFASA